MDWGSFWLGVVVVIALIWVVLGWGLLAQYERGITASELRQDSLGRRLELLEERIRKLEDM